MSVGSSARLLSSLDLLCLDRQNIKVLEWRQAQSKPAEKTRKYLQVFCSCHCRNGTRPCAYIENLGILQPGDLEVSALSDHYALNTRRFPQKWIGESVEHYSHFPTVDWVPNSPLSREDSIPTCFEDTSGSWHRGRGEGIEISYHHKYRN